LQQYDFLKNIGYSGGMGTGTELVNYTYDNSMGWNYNNSTVLNYVCDYVE
jgi:hypothetical protein